MGCFWLWWKVGKGYVFVGFLGFFFEIGQLLLFEQCCLVCYYWVVYFDYYFVLGVDVVDWFLEFVGDFGVVDIIEVFVYQQQFVMVVVEIVVSQFLVQWVVQLQFVVGFVQVLDLGVVQVEVVEVVEQVVYGDVLVVGIQQGDEKQFGVMFVFYQVQFQFDVLLCCFDGQQYVWEELYVVIEQGEVVVVVLGKDWVVYCEVKISMVLIGIESLMLLVLVSLCRVLMLGVRLKLVVFSISGDRVIIWK